MRARIRVVKRIPLGAGLVFSFPFAPPGPGTGIVARAGTGLAGRVVTRARDAVPDEDVHDSRGDDYRREDETVAAELRERDRVH